MASFNRVIVVGNLTRDPELRYVAGGTAVCEASLAVNDKVKRGDQWVDEVSFFDVVFWGRLAEVVNEYLGKGSPLLVEGRLKQERWEKDGSKHSRVKIIAGVMQMLGKKGDGGESRSQSQGRPQSAAAAPGDEYGDF